MLFTNNRHNIFAMLFIDANEKDKDTGYGCDCKTYHPIGLEKGQQRRNLKICERIPKADHTIFKVHDSVEVPTNVYDDKSTYNAEYVKTTAFCIHLQLQTELMKRRLQETTDSDYDAIVQSPEYIMRFNPMPYTDQQKNNDVHQTCCEFRTNLLAESFTGPCSELLDGT